MITARELVEILQKGDLDRIVVLASDSAGNSYMPMSAHWTGAYKRDNRSGSDAGLEQLTKEDQEMGYSEEDVIKGGTPAIILVPAGRFSFVDEEEKDTAPSNDQLLDSDAA